MYPTDKCWENGEYTDDYNCEFCDHKEECSGADLDDDDE